LRKKEIFQGVSPDEKIFTPTDERGFLPYTPHPTPYTLFQVREIGVNIKLGYTSSL
jgi:hypothetical protein